MLPILFSINGINIYTFGLFLSLAVLAVYLRLRKDISESDASSEKINLLVFGSVFFAILFAYVSVYVFHEMSSSAKVYLSGIVFFISGAISLRKISRKAFAESSYALLPSFLLGFSIIKLGSQLAGDGSYGKITNSPWGMSYMTGTVPTAPGLMFFPLPLYESTAALILLGLVLVAKKKNV